MDGWPGRVCLRAERGDEGMQADGEEKQGDAKEKLKGVQSGQGPVPDLVHQAMRMELLPCDKAAVRMLGKDNKRNAFSQCLWEDDKYQTAIKPRQRAMAQKRQGNTDELETPLGFVQEEPSRSK